MIPVRFLRVVAGLGAGLFSGILLVSAQNGPVQDQINDHEQKLAQARASHDAKEQASELIALGYLYRQQGVMQKALGCLEEALPIEQHNGNKLGEAMVLNIEGRVYTDMGQQEKAIGLLDRALQIWRSADATRGVASTLNNLGRAYNELGRRDEALKALNDSLTLWQQLNTNPEASSSRLSGRLGQRLAERRGLTGLPGMREAVGLVGEASTLDNLGKTYSDMGRDQEAIQYFERALPLWRQQGEQGGEALTLNNEARAFADLGKKQEALQAFGSALDLWRAVGNRQGEAVTLNNLGRLYRDLGQHQSALDYYNQALPLWRAVANRNGEGLALNDIGRAYADMGESRKALDYFNQAIPIWKETGNRRGAATTLNNMGRAWSLLGDPERALELDGQALAAWREVKDQRGEALALLSLGWGYSAQKNLPLAVASELAALRLAKNASDPEIEGAIESTLMFTYRKGGHTEEAILFGTDAVNAYQRIRRNIVGLDKDLQTGFVQSKSATYRQLAELLVQADRLAEAEQVLDLLKEQELKEVVRGAATSATQPVTLTDTQQHVEDQLATPEARATGLVDMSLEYAALKSKTAWTAEESARMQTLESKIEEANAAVGEFFRKTLYPELMQKGGSADANAALNRERSETSQLQNTLATLGPEAMGVRLLLGEEHAYALVITAQGRKKFDLLVTPEELRNKVLQARNALRHPSSDPKPPLAALYAMVVAPYAAELRTLEQRAETSDHAPTILWSLDGVLRYIPMASLFDGQHYLVERFNNVLFTPESYGHMTASRASPVLRVLAMGLSKSYGGMPALPSVLTELDAVVHDPAVSESHGPVGGVLLSNDQFTYSAFKAQLGSGNGYPVVHIASHFVLETGGGTEPYLLLGGNNAGDPNGYALSLSTLEDSTISFHGTRLLTLSACSTAKGDVAQNGLEVDSLGMIAQRKDAEAVLATLWDVNDASTSRLMRDFYQRWVEAPAEGKAEALRQAQLAFLHSSDVGKSSTSGRGLQTEEPSAASGAATLTHPYYWAPFVLMGNFQ